MRRILKGLDNWLRDTMFEVENPIVKHGSDILPDKISGAFVTQSKHGVVSDDIFRQSTLILGLNEQNQLGKAHAEWGIPVPGDIRRNLFKATLTIRALRIQAGPASSWKLLTIPEKP